MVYYHGIKLNGYKNKTKKTLQCCKLNLVDGKEANVHFRNLNNSASNYLRYFHDLLNLTIF